MCKVYQEMLKDYLLQYGVKEYSQFIIVVGDIGVVCLLINRLIFYVFLLNKYKMFLYICLRKGMNIE